MTGPRHSDLGAYVLGVLDDRENAEFEQHLMTCRRCQTELFEVHDLPDALDEFRHAGAVAAASAPQEDRVLRGAIDQVAAVRRRRRRTTWLAAAAAAILIVIAPVAAVSMAPDSSPPQAVGEVLQASNPGNGVAAKMTLQPKSWGTWMDVELRGVHGPLDCELVAVSRSGESKVVTSWLVPRAGYGNPESPEPLRLQGGAGMSRPDIDRLEFRTSNGPNILNVPA